MNRDGYALLAQVTRELEAYRTLTANGLGVRTDLEAYELVFRHKPCGQIVDPATHLCEG